MKRLGLVLLAFSILNVFELTPRVYGESPLASPLAHKIQVRGASAAQLIRAHGGQLIADYGAFQLFEVPQVSPTLALNDNIEIRDEDNFIMLHSGWLDTRTPAVKAVATKAAAFTGKRLHLVQFAGPVRPEWFESLRETGARVLTYVPQNAYLVYADSPSAAKVQALAAQAPHVQWQGPYAKEYKIHPDARPVDEQGNARPIGTEDFAVQLVADPEANPATLQLLESRKLAPIRRQHRILDYLDIVVSLAPEDLDAVAGQPDVVSIQPSFPRVKLSERQDQIAAGNITGNLPSGPGYLAWLQGKGFTQEQFDASGFVVDVSDSGIDNGTKAPNHFALHVEGSTPSPGRVTYNRLEGTPNFLSTLEGCDGHGTLNAHIIGGYDDTEGFPHTDTAGYHYGLGMCPFVRLGSSVIFDPDSFTNPDYVDLISRAYQDGARISNNSWGAPAGRASGGGYDIDAQIYDALVRDAQPQTAPFAAAGNQEMVLVFAAGNNGPTARSMESPGTAKNVITVGCGENVQPIGGTDSSGVPDSQANSANDLIGFSGRGPCADGRHKPDLVAPGTHVTGGLIQAPDPGPTGTADPCFTGTGVSGGLNSSFFPIGQEFFTSSSGTSHATPCVSGGCALVRQYFINQFTNPPSAAMTKAFLMNSARYQTGANANDTLWSDAQGMGGMNVGMAFDGQPRILRDQLPEDLFTASGQTRTFTGTIANTNVPFRVTLAWTDAPGSTVGNAFNNNLDLTVLVGGQTYKGNVFSGAYSKTGGTADPRNNVESVFLPPGLSGDFVITVTAANINSDGVPNNGHSLDQDFALVVYNGQTIVRPILAGVDSTLLTESCLPTNGVIDVGETVTVGFALQNVGNLATSNLVATLQASSDILNPGGPQSYGRLARGDAAVAQPFTFTAGGTCGQPITATLRLQDGSLDLGVIDFRLQLGLLSTGTNAIQNFDSVNPPALPAGWTTTASGAEAGWTTSAAASDTAPPNAVFVADASNVGLSELISPRIPIISPAAQLLFRQNFGLDADRSRTNVAYDGGVLEIQIGSSAFADILSAGGSFIAGGYNRTINNSRGNPLSGRQAWSGNSGGFISTQIKLPSAAAGQNVVFKWRCGTDSATGGSGWSVDSIALLDGVYVCCGSSDTNAAPTIARTEITDTGVSLYLQSTSGRSYILQYNDSVTDSTWTPVPPTVTGTGREIVLRDTTGLANQRFYRVLVQ
jgi:hypothetical protein